MIVLNPPRQSSKP